MIRATCTSPLFHLPSDDARVRMHEQGDSFITPRFHDPTGWQGAGGAERAGVKVNKLGIPSREQEKMRSPAFKTERQLSPIDTAQSAFLNTACSGD